MKDFTKNREINITKDAEPAGVIALPRSTVRTFPIHKGKRNVFEVVTNQNRSYFLQADDHVSMDEWMKTIERVSQAGDDNVHHSQLPSAPVCFFLLT